MSRPILVSIEALRKVPLLEDLPPERLAALAAQCRGRRFDRGEIIINHRDTDRDVYFVCRGAVSVTAISAKGREVKYRDIGVGEWFGDLAAIDGQRRAANVVAVREAEIVALPAAPFRRLVLEHPAIADRMLRRLAQSVRDMTDRVFELSTLGVENRVHAEVLRLARAAGVTRNQARIEPVPTHEAIAQRISTDRSEVTRAISRLVKLGVCAVERRRALVVLDVLRLERMVDDVGPPD